MFFPFLPRLRPHPSGSEKWCSGLLTLGKQCRVAVSISNSNSNGDDVNDDDDGNYRQR